MTSETGTVSKGSSDGGAVAVLGDDGMEYGTGCRGDTAMPAPRKPEDRR